MRCTAIKRLTSQAQHIRLQHGSELLSFKSLWRGEKKAGERNKKTENRQEVSDMKNKNKSEIKRVIEKEGIPSTKFPEGGDAIIFIDRPLASPREKQNEKETQTNSQPNRKAGKTDRLTDRQTDRLKDR